MKKLIIILFSVIPFIIWGQPISLPKTKPCNHANNDGLTFIELPIGRINECSVCGKQWCPTCNDKEKIKPAEDISGQSSSIPVWSKVGDNSVIGISYQTKYGGYDAQYYLETDNLYINPIGNYNETACYKLKGRDKTQYLIRVVDARNKTLSGLNTQSSLGTIKSDPNAQITFEYANDKIEWNSLKRQFGSIATKPIDTNKINLQGSGNTKGEINSENSPQDSCFHFVYADLDNGYRRTADNFIFFDCVKCNRKNFWVIEKDYYKHIIPRTVKNELREEDLGTIKLNTNGLSLGYTTIKSQYVNGSATASSIANSLDTNKIRYIIIYRKLEETWSIGNTLGSTNTIAKQYKIYTQTFASQGEAMNWINSAETGRFSYFPKEGQKRAAITAEELIGFYDLTNAQKIDIKFIREKKSKPKQIITEAEEWEDSYYIKN